MPRYRRKQVEGVIIADSKQAVFIDAFQTNLTEIIQTLTTKLGSDVEALSNVFVTAMLSSEPLQRLQYDFQLIDQDKLLQKVVPFLKAQVNVPTHLVL